MIFETCADENPAKNHCSADELKNTDCFIY